MDIYADCACCLASPFTPSTSDFSCSRPRVWTVGGPLALSHASLLCVVLFDYVPFHGLSVGTRVFSVRTADFQQASPANFRLQIFPGHLVLPPESED